MHGNSDQLLPNDHGFRSIFTRILKDCTHNTPQQKKKNNTSTKKKHPIPSPHLLSHGQILHFIITSHGIDTDFFYGSQLIRFYSVFYDLPDACSTFQRLPNPNPFAWSEIISAHAKHGQPWESIRLYRQMALSGACIDGYVMVSVIKACAQMCCLKLGKSLHVEAMAKSLLGFMHNSTFIDIYSNFGRLDNSQAMKRGTVMDMYTKHGNVDGCNIIKKDVIVCDNTSINMYAKCGNLNGSQMIQRGMIMGNATSFGMHATYGHLGGSYIRVMQRGTPMCNSTTDMYGKCICVDGADRLSRQKMETNVVMCNNALIDMYAKCGSVDEAGKLFKQMIDKDIVSWNSLITGLMDHGHVDSALLLFCHMLEERVEPDEVTFLVLVKSATCENCYELSTTIHCFIIEYAIELFLKVGSALIDMYVSHGSISDAQKVFFDMPSRNVVTWTTMVSGYTQCGHCQEAFHAFDQMKQEGLHPDNIALVSILQACSATIQFDRGKAIHLYILDDCDEIDAMLGSALIDMYFKCGRIESACQVFTKLSSPSVIIWNTMINGYAQYGAQELAIQCFYDMRKQGIYPDCATFISVFSACSHAGVLEDGLLHLQSMVDDYDLVLDLKHYMCLVDLLGRTGHVTYAESLLQSLPFSPCEVGWRSLMSNCRTLGDVVRCRRCFDHLVRIDASEPTAYALMAEIYQDSGMTEECKKLKEVGMHRHSIIKWRK